MKRMSKSNITCFKLEPHNTKQNKEMKNSLQYMLMIKSLDNHSVKSVNSGKASESAHANMTGIYADSQTAGSDGLTNLPLVSVVALLRVFIKEEDIKEHFRAN